MSSSQEILSRIREALQEPAPRQHHSSVSVDQDGQPPSGVQRWMPPVGDDLVSQLDLFAKNSADLKTEFHLLPDKESLRLKLVEIARVEGWKLVGSHAGSLTQETLNGFPIPVFYTSSSYAAVELEKCDAGITECEGLVAQTGSVLITNRSSGGRALSVLPPHHVVLVSREQMVRDLATAYALLKSRYGSDYPSLICFITGPSRTGDIERILVLGAHGPKRLTILCY